MNNLQNTSPHNGIIEIGNNGLIKSGRVNHPINSLLDLRDLFHIVFKKLHPLYLIDCGALLLYNDDVTQVRQAYVAEYQKAVDDVFTETIADNVHLKSIFAEIAGFEYPVLKTKQEWEADYDANHCLLNNNSDYVFHCYIPLEKNNRILGTLELHNVNKPLSTEGLTFCSNMADLFAEVVYLLLHQTNQEPESNTPEAPKPNTDNHTFMAGDLQILLSLSNAITAIRNKDDFKGVINTHFKQFSFLCDVIIATINSDGETHSAFLFDTSKGLLTDPLFLQATAKKYPNDGIFNVISASDEPVIFDVDELLKRDNVPEYVRFWKGHCAAEIIGIALSNGGTLIGVLYLHLKDKMQLQPHQLALVKAVSCQISVALANVLAYDEISRQLTQINSYKEQLEDEKLYLQEEISISNNYADIIGQGAEMQQVFQLLNQVSSTESTVLILGETGTGKELIARAIHNGSERREKVMIKVNCAAIPANLIESELFGHEKGSFTGATERRIGKFELANNSTLFLDEIGELSLELQVKLLRVLQEKELERVGGTTTIKTDVRIISATNRDLKEEVEAGRFRRDLFYRLNVFPVNLPSLRNRKDDIPLLAQYFLERYLRKTGKNITGFSQKALKEIRNYHWPGNVRELEHLIERQVLLTKGPMIREIEIPASARPIVISDNQITTIKTIDENERDHIFNVLKMCNGKVSGTDGAAKLLGVPATTLNSKIKRLGLAKTHLY